MWIMSAGQSPSKYLQGWHSTEQRPSFPATCSRCFHQDKSAPTWSQEWQAMAQPNHYHRNTLTVFFTTSWHLMEAICLVLISKEISPWLPTNSQHGRFLKDTLGCLYSHNSLVPQSVSSSDVLLFCGSFCVLCGRAGKTVAGLFGNFWAESFAGRNCNHVRLLDILAFLQRYVC